MKELKKRIGSASGFTLIELLIVIVVIGILAGVVLAVINPVATQYKANQTVLRTNVEKACLALHSCGATTTKATRCDTADEIGVIWPPVAPAAGGTTDAQWCIDTDGNEVACTGSPASADTNTVYVWGDIDNPLSTGGARCRYYCGYNFSTSQTVQLQLSSVAANQGCTLD
ncbi:hypothetical protein A2473_03875 [candidate division WWE3 bacterium RIFOXYC2_FULL_42_13]|uniref:Type II secretion system protein n=1 Tax=candidate division WWE3 bacterium TaxID=2053526 RepID=A0A3D0ZNU6_UNCKA|nr:MAG: hypothetical protein A2245_04400 [candidate division WWE3 bacterium RIFOXYA2_FULL_43_12]OGC72856.1 MAG: hypothetical protein A2473_03875 [candidate division WWE3 bacterium RIFOXYC2_FULL_42_13]OGC74610.1 MAG: hypothetical protein A2547_03610 [candidate division WWE3 bacterium RIFOXYD2_FULL_43_10]HBY09681.1 hypothetical protein [candidate division WWE3 bacterium]HCC41950.1 hypothetical protein [candidate division WWE3 bacterium]